MTGQKQNKYSDKFGRVQNGVLNFFKILITFLVIKRIFGRFALLRPYVLQRAVDKIDKLLLRQCAHFGSF